MRRARLATALALTFLAFSAVVLTSPAPVPQEGPVARAPLNPRFVEYLAARVTARTLLTRSPEGRPLGAVPSPVDLSHLKGLHVGALDREFYPSSYDLRTYGKLTAVRDQNPYGTCWAHATFGSLESALLPAESLDFSENNLANLAGFDWTFDEGGNDKMSAAYLARWDGPALEAEDPYPNPGGSTSIPARKHVQRIDFLPGRADSSDNGTIKQYVMTYGGVYTSMRWDDAAYNSATASYYYAGPQSTNHAVTIAGWDDAYPASNFRSAPPGNGAFLIKNSWGTWWGQAGYFWVSYYDTQIGNDNTMFQAPEATTNYNNVYQYDPLGWIGSLGWTDGTGWFANVFTAKGTEDVKAVSLYAATVNSTYEVRIYVDPTGNNPRSGTLGSQQTGTLTAAGYQTIALATPVTVGAGHRFSAVVKLTTPNYTYPIAIEDIQPGYSSAATASSGQSYYSHSGTSWTDAGADGVTNVCLKAFTSVSTGPQPPTVSGITPTSGPTGGGTPVTITGTNFVGGGTTVTIGGNAATSVVVGSTTSLTAVTPAGTAGARDVAVTTSAGSGALTGGFTYLAAPTVSGIAPNTGPTTGGLPVSITGTGFVVGATTVTIGGSEATSVAVGSSSALSAVTPSGTAGPRNVVVTTGGGSATLANGFTYLVAPTVSSIGPNAGPLAGGTSVTIAGTAFVSGATSVTIGGAAATSVSVVSASSLTARTPAGGAGAKDVVVTTAGGSGTLTAGFTYLAAPTVTSIAPGAGPLAGGTAVTITGTDFVQGATSVTIGGTAATNVVVPGTTSLTAVTPAGTAGAKNVVVTTAGGSATLTGGFSYAAVPTVSSISPNTGSLAGGVTVTITGTGFIVGGTSVTIGGAAAANVAVAGSTLSLTAVVPAGSAGASDVVVATAGGSGTLPGGFTYRAAPTVSSITPSCGPLAGGTSVTVTGTGFVGGATSVTIGGSTATSVIVGSAISLTAVTPAGTAGSRDVVVSTVGGSGTLTSGFTYLAAPTVSAIAPNTGPSAGGTTVTITGSGFVTGATSVTIGGAVATEVLAGSSTSLTAVTPAGAAGAKSVVVTTAGGSGTLTGGFTYLAVPNVGSVSPNSGPLAGGTSVSITGTAFVTGSTSVTIGGAPATGVIVVSPSTLTAVTPAGIAGARDVVVTTAGGSGTLANGFTYLPVPTVSSIAPNSGALSGGTAVTIEGTGFVTGATSVTIGGGAAPGVAVASATSLSAVTPAGTQGARNVVVTTPGGSAMLAGAFTYVAAPGAFYKASPANNAVGQSTTATLTWGASGGAASYEYCYDTTNDSACSAWTSAGSATSATVSGLTFGTTYYWHVRATSAGGTTYANGGTAAFWSFTTQGTALLPAGDFDGDHQADVALFRPAQSAWYIRYSRTGQTIGSFWGGPGDIPVQGDYDGDGRTDIAVYRPSDGGWYIVYSGGDGAAVAWGAPGDIPVPADYDGDGKTDIAVFRPSQSAWYILESSGGAMGLSWGTPGDVPVPADYDGDGKADIGVFRPSDGGWYIVRSSGGGMGRKWGTVGDAPVVGDFDGDGKADIGIFRGSENGWYIIKSSSGSGIGFRWGQAGDVPVFGDFDGDRQADPVVFRASDGGWYVMKSSGGSMGLAWGTVGDLPV